MTLPDPPIHDHPVSGHGELTGHPTVDEVLESLEGLAQRPVDDHVAVYEAASAALRDALAGAVGPTPA